MSDQPFFSVIIPSHNGSKYIRNALDSCAEQSFRDFEIIVICDDCTDDTEEIAKSYGARTRNVNFHHEGPTRNVGIDISRGKWILFLDDDDWWLHEFCFRQLWETICKSNSNTDVVFFDIIWHTQQYCRQDENHWEKMTGGKCYRREFIGDTRWSDVKYSPDLDFFNRLLMKKPKPNFVFTKVPMYFYNYMRPGSISEKIVKGEY